MLVPGAQKCGTAWLSNYVRSFADVDTGLFKEYHVWDALVRPESAHFRTSFLEVLRTRNRRDALRWWLQRSADNYFNHFARILDDPKIRLTADISPSYSGLRDVDFARMKEGFEKRGIAVKVVFLMRDPFERCWSAVRHRKRNNKQPRDGAYTSPNDEAALRAYVQESKCHMRTDYHKTIQNLEKVFDRGAVYYGLFEEIFSPNGLEPLAAFLDLPVVVERIGQAVNTTKKQQEISDDGIRFVVREYADVYRYCFEQFPQTRDLWLSSRYLD